MAASTIETDLVINGNIKSNDGSVEIKGNVVGDVIAASVVVRVGGAVNGALSAKQVSLEGKHKGSLKCESLSLASTSEVDASVDAVTIATESGAKILGQVNVAGRS
ncbi:MAG: polymer-forming cytoskeletal protein [Roseobacter sp.]